MKFCSKQHQEKAFILRRDYFNLCKYLLVIFENIYFFITEKEL